MVPIFWSVEQIRVTGHCRPLSDFVYDGRVCASRIDEYPILVAGRAGGRTISFAMVRGKNACMVSLSLIRAMDPIGRSWVKGLMKRVKGSKAQVVREVRPLFAAVWRHRVPVGVRTEMKPRQRNRCGPADDYFEGGGVLKPDSIGLVIRDVRFGRNEDRADGFASTAIRRRAGRFLRSCGYH